MMRNELTDANSVTQSNQQMYPSNSPQVDHSNQPSAMNTTKSNTTFADRSGYDNFFGSWQDRSNNPAIQQTFHQPVYQSFPSSDRTPSADSQSSNWESVNNESPLSTIRTSPSSRSVHHSITRSNTPSINSHSSNQSAGESENISRSSRESIHSSSNRSNHSHQSNGLNIGSNSSASNSNVTSSHQSDHMHDYLLPTNVPNEDNASLLRYQSHHRPTNQSNNQLDNHQSIKYSYNNPPMSPNYVVQCGESITRHPVTATPVVRAVQTMSYPTNNQSNSSSNSNIAQVNGYHEQHMALGHVPTTSPHLQSFNPTTPKSNHSVSPSLRPSVANSRLTDQPVQQLNESVNNDVALTNSAGQSNSQSNTQSNNPPTPHAGVGGKRPRPPMHSEPASKRPRKSTKPLHRLTPEVISDLNEAGTNSSVSVRETMQPFVDAIRQACEITPGNTTSIVAVLCHFFEAMQPKVFETFLTQLGYEPSDQSDSQSSNQPNQQVVWKSSEEYLPVVSLPFQKFRFHWVASPEKASVNPKDDELPSFMRVGELKMWRDPELNFINDGSGQIIGKPIDQPLLPHESLVQPHEIDLSRLVFPHYVQVSRQFERLFGHLQADIKMMCHQNGKDAMAKLIDADDLKKINDWDMREGMSRGVVANAHYARIITKYGAGMQSLVHHQVSGGNSSVGFPSQYYSFFALPISNDPIVPAGFPLVQVPS